MNKPELNSDENQKNSAIDDYIAQRPQTPQLKMVLLRKLIHDTVPEVSEKISWSMPTFQWKGKNLCHFAANKQHLGFYPGPAAIVAFANELADYQTSKGAIQFPYTEEIPVDLVRKIILYAKTDLNDLIEGKPTT